MNWTILKPPESANPRNLDFIARHSVQVIIRHQLYPRALLLICEALGKDSDYCLDFSIIPEVIHNGTLVIDDIEDSSEMRRGKPCTHKIFQLDIAVNAGNAMYYLPLLPLNGAKRRDYA